MVRLCVMLLPALLFAAGNTSPLTVLPPDNVVTNEVAPGATAQSTGTPFKVDVGVVDTVGGTTYDWQANGPSYRWIAYAPGYGLHVTFMWSVQTSGTTFPDRNMRYNFYDQALGAWNWIDPDFMQSGVNTFSERSGFGGLAGDPATGVALISRHYGTGTLQPGLARDAAPGAGIFEYAAGPVGYLWPPIDVGSNGTIHAMVMDDPNRQNNWYTRVTWPNWETPTMWATPTFPTYNIGASKVSQKVTAAYVIQDATGGQQYAYYRNSSDGGTTWDPIVEMDFPPGYGSDTLTSFHITGMFPFYDKKNDKLHILAATMPNRNDSAWIIPAEIWHWSPDNSPNWSMVQLATCDPLNLGAAVGYNAMYACRPTMGEDRYGGLYVAWEQFDSANVEVGPPSRLRADIFYARDNGDNGATWQTPLRITDQGTWTCRFPSIIDYFPGDTLYIEYLVDQRAGFFLYSEGPATSNPIVVHKIPVNVGINAGMEQKVTGLELSARPNPFAGRTGLAYGVPRPGHVKLEVLDASGRVVARPVDAFKPAGRFSAALEASGLAPGVYLARLSALGSTKATKLVLTD